MGYVEQVELSGCLHRFLFWSWSAQESTLDVVKKRGTLIAGVKNDYPPAGYLDSKGEWVGLDVDMAKYIAKKLGVKLQMEAVSSRTRIPMLVNNNVDLLSTSIPPASAPRPSISRHHTFSLEPLSWFARTVASEASKISCRRAR